jgi:hypothetical protein
MVALGMAGLGPAGEQAADPGGGEADQVFAPGGRPVMIMPRRCPGKLPTGGGVPVHLQQVGARVDADQRIDRVREAVLCLLELDYRLL